MSSALTCYIQITYTHLANDTDLLSEPVLCLCKHLKLFACYCHTEGLTISFSKSKVLLFREGVIKQSYRWTVIGQELEQVVTFSYFGVPFLSNLSWMAHLEAVVRVSNSSASAIT